MPDSGLETSGAALVTGASRGIGRVIAARLAAAGRPVAVNYRSAVNEANEVVRLIVEVGGSAIALQADVADPDQLSKLISRAESALGPLAVLVNNAGITRDRLVVQMTEADWEVTWMTDLAAARTLSRLAVATMAARAFGRIVNIGSVVGVSGNSGQANYSAAKSALLGLTRDLAVRCAKSGITVNAVVPGYIATDATAHLTEEQQARWLDRIPMGRYALPDDVAGMVVFLASEGASYITGQCIAVDGGLLAAAGAPFAP